MKLTLGFSPCPNDTFIFDALVNKKIDTEGLEVEPVLEDVQTLNEWALKGKLDITKISYGVLPLIIKDYIVLNAGGALGKGVGPLFITRNDGEVKPVEEMTVAIPGEQTTAHMLFSLAYPQVRKKKFLLFSEIEDAILNGQVDAGVIIHENRFTYQDKGLLKLADLGEYWETTTSNPIPLGGIVIRRNIDPVLQRRADSLIRRSLEYSFAHYPAVTDYVKQHAQEMSEAVMRQHIDLYVNNYSLDLGSDGRSAVKKFLDIYGNLHQTSVNGTELFLENNL
ncbi:1,4-dihydroxy-6-naphthoate synthase [Pseudobacter ginsenosidimutans]|uniref:1,4-dihydroxy-6-naphtoate synthase n=1 Tax=Pseudobacter ginsenosidimutans TaxID=661488 RepID=A0A4Q7MQ12_9BACT|nr:1,4-dihydroxy-6-naphthoate synthase [Pseudobacter ginsenosidimutans]QEC40488.1 1,4-dihydroxy-6-naphthoate synthase [Pseudobacter ginsenosidimutans]RZS68902.1 1,4-dihydroxy-6-naphthoate synthase [Pseudobacter ginsenosidimutans]